MRWPNDVLKPQIHQLRPSRTLCSIKKQVGDFRALKAMIAWGINAGIKDKKIKVANCCWKSCFPSNTLISRLWYHIMRP